jgi:hypothetical protein
MEVTRPSIPHIEDDESPSDFPGNVDHTGPSTVNESPMAAPAVQLTSAPVPVNSDDDSENEPDSERPLVRLEDTLEFMDYPATRTPNRRNSGAVLEDIIAHLPSSYGQTYYDNDPITHGHETSHGIHSDILRLGRPSDPH